jgi:hypothetical protein
VVGDPNAHEQHGELGEPRSNRREYVSWRREPIVVADVDDDVEA